MCFAGDAHKMHTFLVINDFRTVSPLLVPFEIWSSFVSDLGEGGDDYVGNITNKYLHKYNFILVCSIEGGWMGAAGSFSLKN